VANGSHIDSNEWMPVVGYDDDRRLHDQQDRQKYGLPERSARPSLENAATLADKRHVQPIQFEAVISTSENQIAVAPGTLQRTWTSGNRKYFHYVAETPIFNEFAFFSAKYAVKESTWTPPESVVSAKPVTIQIYHHPSHLNNIDRMMKSIRASLEFYSREFGPYPHRHFRVIERPGPGRGMHAEPMTIDYPEGYSLMNPDPEDLDLPYHIMAHEVAHQWWGFQLAPAPVEGSGLLVESLATFSAMQVVEESLGEDHLQNYLTQMRQEYEVPRSRAAPPLLRSNSRFMNYRKGPFALFALRRYTGKTNVNTALRELLKKHAPSASPLPSTLDLYRELKAVTPDSLHYLLHDLFAANTFWELEAREAVATKNAASNWQVSLSFDARKVTVDSLGTETVIPMNDWVEIGVYSTREGGKNPQELYRQLHRIRSGRQTVSIDVTALPGRAGIDPRHLLIDLDIENNTTKISHE
jgi:aminopeptidase N